MLKTAWKVLGIVVVGITALWFAAFAWTWLLGWGGSSSPPKDPKDTKQQESLVEEGGRKFAPTARRGGAPQVTPMAQEWARDCAGRPYTRAWREPHRYRCKGEEGTITVIGGGETIVRGFGR